eukprot:10483205-Alexandrium_andersonii.AAC.1
MSASLVGSEMCIRDSALPLLVRVQVHGAPLALQGQDGPAARGRAQGRPAARPVRSPRGSRGPRRPPT